MAASNGNEVIDFNPMSVEDFGTRTHEELVYNETDVYLGGDEPIKRIDYLYQDDKIVEKTITIPPAIVQIFYEIISNSADAVACGRRRGMKIGWDCEAIKVTMDQSQITVWNTGIPIPIQKHPKTGQLVPTTVFGSLLSSSHYGEVERSEAGKNGLGAKTANILSKEFIVEVADPSSGKHFYQRWSDNMKEVEDPVIKKLGSKSKPFVKISYTLDFERFKCQQYPEEAIPLFARICADTSFTSKCRVRFNDSLFDNTHIKDYASLYFKEAIETSVLHYQLQEDQRIVQSGKLQWVVDQDGNKIIPTTEILLLDPTKCQSGKIISFVNSANTPERGVHINKVYEQLLPTITDQINGKDPLANKAGSSSDGKTVFKRRLAAQKARAKRSKKNTRVGRKYTINIGHVRNHITMIASFRVKNPKFASQNKTRLTSPVPQVKFPPKVFKKIFGWGLMNTLSATLRVMQMTSLASSDGAKVKDVALGKALDAHLAGTNRSAETELWVVEGLSAAGYALTLVSEEKNGRDFKGILPIRGKIPNVTKIIHGKGGPDEQARRLEKLANNKEIALLKKALGLREGVDYSTPENRERLRYGKLVCMTDADTDGHHIKGLVLNIFYVLYPGLLEAGFIEDYRTPCIRAKLGKTRLNFYTMCEFRKWCQSKKETERWKIEYFKGLGSSDDAEIISDSKIMKQLTFVSEDVKKTEELFSLAFFPKRADDRKRWGDDWLNEKNKDFELTDRLPIETFFRREFIEYIMDSWERAIPRLSDGLKKSQGQIIWGAVKKWKSNNIPLPVSRLASMAAVETNYHHGEKCLSDAIIKMAQKFIGSNNLPLLVDKGQYGTRVYGGADAAQPRYPKTFLTPYFYKLFRKEDTVIYRYNIEEGEKVDPTNFMPIIPLQLVNGAHGIATGWNTSIPSYNPLDLIDEIMAILTDGEREILVPWYRDFKGKIELIPGTHRGIKTRISIGEQQFDQLDSEEKVSINKSNYYDKVTYKGVYQYRDRQLTISELPPKLWTIKYIQHLDDMKKARVITSYRDRSDKTKVDILIRGLKEFSPDVFWLIKRTCLSNLVLLDVNGVPRHYKSADQILEHFVDYRLLKYKQRRDVTINNMESEIKKAQDRVKIIEHYLTGELIIKERSVKDVLVDIKKLGIDPKMFTTLGLKHLTRDHLEKLRKTIRDKIKVLNDYRKMSPQDLWINELEELRVVLNRMKCFS